MKTKELVEKIWTGALMVLPQIDCRTDFTVDALKQNEKIIDELYPFGHKPLITTILPFAIHLGETIIKESPGAKWVDKEIIHLDDLEIEIPTTYTKGNLQCFPVNRVKKFWMDSREYSLSNMVNSMKFLSQNDMSDPKFQKLADKDGWFEIGGGDLIRITVLKIDDSIN